MIGYVMVGTNDLPKAGAFYDAVLAELGAKRGWDTDRFIAWGNSPTAASLAVTKPHDGNVATVGNGTMVALAAPNRATVDKVHAKALSLGAKDEGAPGLRGDTFYGAYFRDLDGNKIACFCMKPE